MRTIWKFEKNNYIDFSEQHFENFFCCKQTVLLASSEEKWTLIKYRLLIYLFFSIVVIITQNLSLEILSVDNNIMDMWHILFLPFKKITWQ